MLTSIAVIITAKSPLAHGADEKAGIDSLFRRQRFVVGDRFEEVPIISGNAVRGRLRRVAAERYFTALGLLEKSLPPWLYYACVAGGSIQKGAEGGRMGIADRRAVRENVPFLSLWGTAWRSEIMQGKLTVGMLLPICREMEEYTAIPESRSIHEFIDEVSLTRKDDRESKWIAREAGQPSAIAEEGGDDDEPESSGDAVAAPDTQKEIDYFNAVEALNAPASASTPATKTKAPVKRGAGVQMLYRTEVLVPGTRFAGLLILDDANPVEAACLADTLAAWRENPTLGGKASGGFGRVDMAVTSGALPDAAPYAAYLTERRDAIREWLGTQGVRLE